MNEPILWVPESTNHKPTNHSTIRKEGGMMAENMAQRVFELHGRKLSERKIADQLKITRHQVRKILTTNQPTNQPTTPGDGRLKSLIDGVPDLTDEEDLRKEDERAFERELWLKSQPIMRKVALNPKIIFYYDYLVEKGYEGDMGDFLIDMVEDFFRSRGYSVRIIHEEEIK